MPVKFIKGLYSKYKEKQLAKYQDTFTKCFHPFLERVYYFFDKEISPNVKRGLSGWTRQEYPFGEITMSINNNSYFESKYEHDETYGRLKIDIDKNFDFKILAIIRFKGDPSTMFTTISEDILQQMQEYPQLLRIVYSLSYYQCVRQIAIFKEQRDDAMVKHFTDKKKDFEQQLLGL